MVVAMVIPHELVVGASQKEEGQGEEEQCRDGAVVGASLLHPRQVVEVAASPALVLPRR